MMSVEEVKTAVEAPVADADPLMDLRGQIVDSYLAYLDNKNFARKMLAKFGKEDGILARQKAKAKELLLTPLETSGAQDQLLSGVNLPPEIKKLQQFIKTAKAEGSGFLPSIFKAAGISLGVGYAQTDIEPVRTKLRTLGEQELNTLKAELDNAIETGGMVPRDAAVVAGATVAGGAAVVSASTPEVLSDRRKVVLQNIDAILAQDEIENIPYAWGGNSSIEAGLDCGGLVAYTLNQAGLAVERNGRSLFEKFPSKKLEIDDKGSITTDVSDIQEGDVLVFDALVPAFYTANPERIQEITGPDGQMARIRHFAFIKSIDREKGIIHTIESAIDGGVKPRERNVKEWLQERGDKNSAFHVIHVDYEKLDRLSADALANLEELPGAVRAA